MNKSIYLKSASFVSLMLSYYVSIAQIYEKATPYTFQYSTLTNSRTVNTYKSNHITLDPINNEEQTKQADKYEEECSTCRKDYFGVGVSISLDIKKNANRIVLPDKSKLYLLTVSSADAHGLQFYFDKYNIPPGAKLFFYNKDRSHVLGAFTSRNNRSHNKFTVQPIAGDSITIEYHEPSKVKFSGKLSIYRVVHVFKDIFVSRNDDGDAGFNKSKSCHINVSRSSLRDAKKAVCRIIMYDKGRNSTFFCTGALINNNFNGEGTYPFVLTAAHCLRDKEDNDLAYNEAVFYFNYESSLSPAVSEPDHETVVGATLFSRGTVSDYGLFGLAVRPESVYSVSYAGWDRNIAIAPLGTESIHHPNGDIKKMAQDYDIPVRTIPKDDQLKYEDVRREPNRPQEATHWEVQWDLGITERGSSGSPLLDDHGHIIGQLQGGRSDCDERDEYDYYGCLSYSWNHPDQGWRPLKEYLDPSEIASTMVGYFPSDPNGGGSNPSCTATVRDHGDLQGIRITVEGGKNRRDFGNSVAISSSGIIVSGPSSTEQTSLAYQKKGCTIKPFTVNNELSGEIKAMSGQYAFLYNRGNYSAGYINVYKKEQNGWVNTFRIDPPDYFTDKQKIRFAYAADISGNYAIVNTTFAGDATGVYFYERQPDERWLLKSVIKTNEPDEYIGQSVAIHGKYAIVGSSYKIGAAYKGKVIIYERKNGDWNAVFVDRSTDDIGDYVGISDKYAITNFGHLDGVLTFKRSGSAWSRDQKLDLHVDGSYNRIHDFAITDSYIVLGASQSAGAAYIFRNDGNDWQLKSRITPSNGIPSDNFGRKVAINGDYIVVSAGENSCHYSGSVYVYNIPSILYRDDKGVCNYAPSPGNYGTIGARNISIGGSNCSVSYQSGVAIAYHAGEIVIKNGFHAKSGSNLRMSTYDCSSFSNPTNAIVSRIKTSPSYELVTYNISSKEDISSSSLNESFEIVKVYPNPSDGQIQVISTLGKPMQKVQVYDLYGSLILDQKAETKIAELDFTEHPAGLYIVRMVYANQVIEEKIIKR